MGELKLNINNVVFGCLEVAFIAYPINESSNIGLATSHQVPCFVFAEFPVAELFQLRACLYEKRICFLQMGVVVKSARF